MGSISTVSVKLCSKVGITEAIRVAAQAALPASASLPALSCRERNHLRGLFPAGSFRCPGEAPLPAKPRFRIGVAGSRTSITLPEGTHSVSVAAGRIPVFCTRHTHASPWASALPPRASVLYGAAVELRPRDAAAHRGIGGADCNFRFALRVTLLLSASMQRGGLALGLANVAAGQ